MTLAFFFDLAAALAGAFLGWTAALLFYFFLLPWLARRP